MEKMLKFCNLPSQIWEEDQKAWRSGIVKPKEKLNENINTNISQ